MSNLKIQKLWMYPVFIPGLLMALLFNFLSHGGFLRLLSHQSSGVPPEWAPKQTTCIWSLGIRLWKNTQKKCVINVPIFPHTQCSTFFPISVTGYCDPQQLEKAKMFLFCFVAYISSSQTIIDGTSGQGHRAEPMGKWCLLAWSLAHSQASLNSQDHLFREWYHSQRDVSFSIN